MQINLIPDASVAYAPAGFTAAIQTAAAIFQQDFSGNFTVNISYGWGTWDNQVDPLLSGSTGAEGGPVNGATVSYSTLKSWLMANANLPDQQAAYAWLPSTAASFPGGVSSFYVTSAQEKAFGVLGNSTAIDGAIGFGTASSPTFWLEAALHEIAHALARTTDYYAGEPTIMDLFRYSAAGQYDWTGYDPAYLSFNGGRTIAANFSTVSDFADFAVNSLTPTDPFDWEVTGGTQNLTSLDLQLMNVLGFGSTVTPTNVSISVVGYASVNAGQAIDPSTLIVNISNPQNHPTGPEMFIDNGGGSGYLTLNGVAQPDGQWITAASGDVVQYVGGSSSGTDTLQIAIYDETTHSYAFSSIITAITVGGQTTTSGNQPGSGSSDSWDVAGYGSFVAGASISEMVVRDTTTGDLNLYYVGGQAPSISLGQVGLDWQVVGFGDFSSNPGETDMLMRDATSGDFEIYNIGNNAIASAAPMGQVGLNWQIAGFGNFSSNPLETDMLLRDTQTGTFELYDISHNNITFAYAMGSVGLDWQIAGFGNFSSNANETDMLLRNSGTGTFELYDISHNAITFAYAMGSVGLDWQIAGFGDFSSNPNETDMLLRNSTTGAFEIYDINHNQITMASPMGQVGLDWQVVGFGDFSGNPNETDMLMRNSNSGDFETLLRQP